MAGCASAQFDTYQLKADGHPNWQIIVSKTQVPFTIVFKVIINDSTVINKGTNAFAGWNLDTKGTYRDHQIKLVENYTSGFLGFGTMYHALVFVDNHFVKEFNFH